MHPYPYPDEANPIIKNPQTNSLLALSGPLGLFLLPALLALVLILNNQWDHPLLIPALIGTGLFAIFALSALILWGWGWWQIGQIKAFLASERPLLRWVYDPEEWREIKEAIWEEEQGDWKIQLGCLTALFSLIGLLVGVMIGAEEGIEEMIGGGFTGLLAGAMLGAVIGSAVAGGNYLAARRTYHKPRPDPVVLAPHEIYANGQYFKGDGRLRYIREARLEPGDPTLLHLEIIIPPKPRSSGEQEWLIMIPPRLVEAVQGVIPHLTP